MLNHKFNACKSKSKSKIFITVLCIFGLLFSYSCSCKNNVTGPGNDGLENGKVTNIDAPLGTFAPRLDLGNSYNVSFTSEGVEKLHASVKFIEPNKYGYKAEITEVTDKEGEITKDKIQYNDDGTFTIPEATLKALAGKLTAENNMPATNEVSITFKLTSTDTSLNNNTTNITKTFNFIKAFKFDKSNIEGLLQSSTHYQIQIDGESLEKAFFAITNGTYNATLNTFTIKELENNLKDTDSIPKSKFQYIDRYLRNGENTKHYFKSVTLGESKEKGNTLEFDLTLVFGDVYETDILMPITLSVTKSKGKWTDN